jgi:nicotinamide riboside kinase
MPEAAHAARGGAAVVAIVGAESTGKSRLAQALAARLAEDFGLRAVVVGEVLREWCDARGRTPRPDEQAAIAREQQRRADDAAARPDVDLVVCDTTPLMTAVYSALLFDDRSLDAFAAACQRRADLTLLTALDLPWVADGLQRDGPHVRAPVDAQVRARLAAWGVDWSLVSGVGEARAAQALDALRPLLRRRAERSSGGSGLFGRLQDSLGGPPRPVWTCERCDEPGCEHLVRSRLAGLG